MSSRRADGEPGREEVAGVLGVPQLDGLRRGGDLGRVVIQALPLGDGKGARVRPYGLPGRDAYIALTLRVFG
jgi:hypothetical protein